MLTLKPLPTHEHVTEMYCRPVIVLATKPDSLQVKRLDNDKLPPYWVKSTFIREVSHA